MGIRQFDYCLSNPPYQLSKGKGVTVEIYQDFQTLANHTSKQTAMIYPRNWVKNIKVKPGKDFIKQGLYSTTQLDNNSNLFPTIHKNIPLCINICKKDYLGDIRVVSPFKGEDFTLERDTRIWISEKIQKTLLEQTRQYSTLKTKLYFETSETNIQESTLAYHDKPFDGAIGVYIKQIPGKASDAGWFYVAEKDLLHYYPSVNLTQYKVMIKASIIGRLGVWQGRVENVGSIKSTVFTPRQTSGKTKYVMRMFPTLEEAQNFSLYINLSLSVKLLSLNIQSNGFGEYLPDLVDYSNNNPIFTPSNELPSHHEYKGLTLNQRLHALFNIPHNV